MHIDLIFQPGNSAARVALGPSESITAEGGAMIAMSGDMAIETSTKKRGGGGGILSGLKRMISGESFFMNHFTAGPSGGELFLATTLPGDMMQLDLQGETIIVQSGSFVACSDGVDIDLGWQGFKSLLSGESVFWLKISGTGKAILSSFGAIYPQEVNGEYIVDSGHIVSFDESLQFKITKPGKSWLNAILGGEGLVCKFEGQGTVWCQSHNPSSFGFELGSLLKPRA